MRSIIAFLAAAACPGSALVRPVFFCYACPMGTSTTFQVRVQPRAKRNAVVPVSATELKVYVTVPPEDGRANAAVIELLAEHWGVKRRQLELVSGATNRNKVIRLTSA